MSINLPSHSGDQLAGLPKLTSFESIALDLPYNLADGHATFRWPKEYRLIAASISSLFFESLTSKQADAERLFVETFCTLSQQKTPILSTLTPSASLSLEIAANALKISDKLSVGLFHPTFDNLADILRRVGLSLAPLDPEAIVAGDLAPVADLDALLLVWPNNPTGHAFSKPHFDDLVAYAEAHGTALVFDFSFRLFAPGMADFDQYVVLKSSQVDWIAIEDTGKVMPANDLKVSLLGYSDSFASVVRGVAEDMFLASSRFSLRLNAELLRASSSVQDLPAAKVALSNARSLDDVLGELVVPTAGPISVRMIDVGSAGMTGTQVVAQARQVGVGLLPGAPFYWSDPGRGAGLVRVSLVRDEAEFAAGTAILADLIADGLLV